MYWRLNRCPGCKSPRVYRIGTHTLYQRIVSAVIVPLRCDTCLREFLRVRLFAPKFGASMPKRANILIR
jgi:hypothetical protein